MIKLMKVFMKLDFATRLLVKFIYLSFSLVFISKHRLKIVRIYHHHILADKSRFLTLVYHKA
jgi:hypothetical protein